MMGMRRSLRVAASLLALRCGQADAQSFNTYVNGLPVASPLGPSDVFYILQGGVSKKVPVVSVGVAGVVVSGTPSSGYILTATGPTTAVWAPNGGGGGGSLLLPPGYVPCNPTGITAPAIACKGVTTGFGLNIDPVTNVLSLTEPPPAFSVVAPLQFTGGNTSLQITGLANSVLAGSGPAFTGSPTLSGPLMVGTAAYAIALPGDLAVARTSSPTTGSIYLGSAGTGFIQYDGTSSFQMNASVSAIGNLVSTGAGSGFVINSRLSGFANVAVIYSPDGNLHILTQPLNADAVIFNATTGAAAFSAGVTATGYTAGAAVGVTKTTGCTITAITGGLITGTTGC